MDPRKDYYGTLGVAETATREEIRKAFRRLAKKCHPDLNPGDKAAEARFKEINEAHEVLGDPEKRRAYDAARRGAYAGAGGPGGFAWEPGGGGPGDVFFRQGGIDLGDLLGDFLRGGEAAGRGADVAVEIEVEFIDMARGAVRELSYRRPKACPACRGTGRAGRRPCAPCGGAGATEVAETVRFRIPAGAADGATIRIPGKGGEGAAGIRGDLAVRLRMRPHPVFRRSGRDVVVDLPLNYSEAVRGTKVSVPTVDGPVKVTVPPGSGSGRKLRLKGRGIPEPGTGERGDQFVVVQIVVPGNRTGAFLDLVDRLAAFEEPDPRGGWN